MFRVPLTVQSSITVRSRVWRIVLAAPNCHNVSPTPFTSYRWLI